ncbi:hypothetical protein [Streptomyces virginiae]|uniref:hypothetical protein n=1 Tax=Streptomyces virginiae TaxID=1961 RepID=UPI00367982D4
MAPTLQQRLTASVLRPGNLLSIVRHYVFEKPMDNDGDRAGTPGGRARSAGEPKTAKVVCRHQQYRATEKIVGDRDRLVPLSHRSPLTHARMRRGKAYTG